VQPQSLSQSLTSPTKHIEQEVHLPTPSDHGSTDQFQTWPYKNWFIGKYLEVYGAAKTPKKYFQLHPATSGRQNADWGYDTKGNKKGPIFFFRDPKTEISSTARDRVSYRRNWC
jgi:hypothetical protein